MEFFLFNAISGNLVREAERRSELKFMKEEAMV